MASGQTRFSFDAPPAGVRSAVHRALPARAGHFDELRGPDGGLRPHWAAFFAHLGEAGFADLDRRAATLARNVREDGVTYNVYGDEHGPARPWSLDLLPMIIGSAEWAGLAQGVAQRARLMARILDDIYGPQRLLHEGLLPPALVLGHSGYLRPLAGTAPPGGLFLHLVAFDLARAHDGHWSVVAQRTSAPSGLGYALQNRLIVARLFPEAFRAMRVQRLASGYRRLLDLLDGLAPVEAGSARSARIVLLTPGPYNETYFEHAFLARYLGVPLVEGGDLMVRGERVYLKTLRGLERVHAIVRRLDDDFCDPLELRSDSTLGVPGLLQAVRAGQVVVSNPLGAGFLESPAINGFLPPIARRLLGEELVLPALDTWWFGERAALEQALPRLAELVLKPTYPSGVARVPFDAISGAAGSGIDDIHPRTMLPRIEADPEAFTAQAFLPFSQLPTWHQGTLVPRVAMLRVYAVVGGDGQWHVLPGGLTRIASGEQQRVSMQRGGSSADTWVLTDGPVDRFTMLPDTLRPEDLAALQRPVTSRVAENLFWMGRYTERVEHGARLARAALGLLADDVAAPPEVLEVLGAMCERQGLVPPGVPSPVQSNTVFERTLVRELLAPSGTGGIAFNLAALVRAGTQIRDRLSAEHWRLIVGAEARFHEAAAATGAGGLQTGDEAVEALGRLAVDLAAITGAQTDRMTRDDGWRLLAIGRRIERLTELSGALAAVFGTGGAAQGPGLELLLSLFDSSITYRALYQRRLERAPLLELLVREAANPRALASVAAGVRSRVAELQVRLPPAAGGGAAPDLAGLIPDPATWPSLAALCEEDEAGRLPALLALCDALVRAAMQVSDEIGQRCFSHAAAGFRPLSR